MSAGVVFPGLEPVQETETFHAAPATRPHGFLSLERFEGLKRTFPVINIPGYRKLRHMDLLFK